MSGKRLGHPPGVDIRVLPGGDPQFSVFHSADMPDWATFAFYVPDNSMRPVFKKNTLLYCDSLPLQPGDIGLFLYHGNTVCRQYNKDVFGTTYLFALDRKRQYEDIVLYVHQEKDLTCFGRVRIKRPVLLPQL